MANQEMLSTDPNERCQTTDSKWDKAILDAQTELAAAEQRVGRLRVAIKIFMENKVKGVPWPGTPARSR